MSARLADKLCAFVSFKNALGIKYETCQVHLRQLDQYNLAHGNYGTLTKEVAEGWALERRQGPRAGIAAGFRPFASSGAISEVSATPKLRCLTTDSQYNITMQKST